MLFVALAFSLSWALDLLNWRLGGTANPANATFLLFLVLAMFGPGVAAAIMLDLVSREGLRSAGLRWGPWRYYLIAYFLVLGMALAIYALTLLLGLGRLDREALTLTQRLQSFGVAPAPAPGVLLPLFLGVTLTSAVLVNALYAFGEELGWRGYLLPSLLPLGKLRACLISGAIWGVWHTPLILMGHLYPGYPLWGVLLTTLMTVFLGVVFGWLRLASGSLLPPTLAHAALNAQVLFFPSFLVVGVNPVLGGGTGVVGLGVMALVALGLYLTGRLRETPQD